MLLPLIALLLAGCLNMDTYAQRRGEAMCDKYFECKEDEGDVEDFVNAQNWDGTGECYGDAADGSESTMENEEATACRNKYCDFDMDNAQDCLDAIREIDCDDLATGEYDISDCDKVVVDCPDTDTAGGGDIDDDYADCIENAAKNEPE